MLQINKIKEVLDHSIEITHHNVIPDSKRRNPYSFITVEQENRVLLEGLKVNAAQDSQNFKKLSLFMRDYEQDLPVETYEKIFQTAAALMGINKDDIVPVLQGSFQQKHYGKAQIAHNKMLAAQNLETYIPCKNMEEWLRLG